MQDALQLSRQLPLSIYQLTEQHQLGQFRALYRRRMHRFLLWFLPVWLALATLTLAYDIYMVIISYSALSSPIAASAAMQLWGGTVQLILAITAFVLRMMGVNPFWGFKKHLYIMDNGLLYMNGKKTETVRWDEIENIFWWKKRGISYFSRKDGSTFTAILEMEKAQEVSAVVAEVMAERLLPEVLTQYQQTGQKDFGPLSITHEGIAKSSQATPWANVSVIPWAEIEDVRFKRGALGIKMGNKWKEWDEGTLDEYLIPNPTICVALIKHILVTANTARG